MPFAEDAGLVKEFKAGKIKAFNEIVIKYKDKVFNTSYRFLGNYQEANDLAQECFITVYDNIESFRGESSLSTWIYRIVINTCKNKLKSFSRKKNIKTVSLKDKILEAKDNTNSPVKLLEKKELEANIQDAINSLQDDWREVVVLRDIEGLDYESIAEAAGCDIGTVKSRLHRARMDLKDKLKSYVRGE